MCKKCCLTLIQFSCWLRCVKSYATLPMKPLVKCLSIPFKAMITLTFVRRHHVQLFRVTTMQLAFQITVTTNTNVIAFRATEESIAKQVS